jgi:CTP synthase
MMKSEIPDDVATVMVSYLPVPGSIGEMKTKPTQTAVRALNGVGVFADLIIARSSTAVDEKRKEKIARFCNLKSDYVISAPDVDCIYNIPLNFEKEKLSERLCTLLQLPTNKKIDLKDWNKFLDSRKKVKDEVKIAVVGKYFSSGDFVLSDVYLSVLEAIKYSAYSLGLSPKITYLSSADFEDEKKLKTLNKFDGVLVPGGFGKTGVNGKLKVIEYVRKKKIPYFGICYGMQLAVLEYAKNVLKLEDVSTAEINPKAKHKVVDIMPEQIANLEKEKMGGTMRLGAYEAILKKGTQAQKAYKSLKISERHRHRYEVNPEYIERLSQGGVIFSGTSQDERLMEIMELPIEKHPFFVGVQFHPEFKARPLSPHPLFTSFIQAAYEGNH